MIILRKKAKPFLKWAGGKTQLIEQIRQNLPKELFTQKFTYIEPFVGSGAMLFWVMNNYPNVEKVVINDINEDLINTYKVIKSTPVELVLILQELQNEYYSFGDNQEAKKEYYLEKRTLYNLRTSNNIEQAALFIFLNRTCFNGLYRVNSKNEFNVPMGNYKNPTICDKENILAISEVLQKVEILCGDYQQTLEYANKNSFFYFDPPYKPLSQTSSFNSYAKDTFDDEEQMRLQNFCRKLDDLGYHWMLSNSDVKGYNPDDIFFDDLYKDFQIQRVEAKRSINADPSKRGKITELLITNYFQINEYDKQV